MSRPRVVVTGVGMVNALGCHVEESFANMLAGRSGAGPIRFYDPGEHGTRFACEPPETFSAVLKKYTTRRFLKQTIKFTQLGYIATRQMLEDYPVDWERVDRERVGIPMGVGGIGLYGDQNDTWAIVRCMSNALPAWISMEYGIEGPSLVVSTACASSGDAIATAFRMLRSGELDLAITGGADAACVSDIMMGFGVRGELSTRNDAPEQASRPFDRDRDGFVMGEGAGVCILETEEHALRRGAPILCEMLGFASTTCPNEELVPVDHEAGMRRTMSGALKNAGLTPADIDYISAHAASSREADRHEALAIKHLFEGHPVMISAQKSQIGHCMGGAGGVEFVCTALSVARDVVTPTINLENPEPEWAELDLVPGAHRESRVRAALSNSFAYGGQNCTVVLSKYQR